MHGKKAVEEFVIKTTEEEFLAKMEIAEKEYEKDPVAFNARHYVELDKLYRPTLYRLEHGQRENILIIGDWAVDPDGEVLDIVHICDGDKFFSPTVGIVRNLVPSSYKSVGAYRKGAYSLVCVTCGSKPSKDVDVVIDLMLRRQENLGEGKDTIDDFF